MNKGQVKQLPQPGNAPLVSLEAEQAVLGSILLNPKVLDDLGEYLKPEDFYREAHAEIYRAMLDLHRRNQEADSVMVHNFLRDAGKLESVGGPGFLMGLAEGVGFAVNVSHYAGVVRRKSLLRQVQGKAQAIAAACHQRQDNVEQFIDWAEAEIFQVAERNCKTEMLGLEELVPAEKVYLEKLFEKRGRLGVPTGFRDLDKKTGGFQPGDLIILAARPSMGKSALAMNIAYRAAQAGNSVAFFSLEMSTSQLLWRLFSSACSIPLENIRFAKMTPDEWLKLETMGSTLGDLPIHIDPSPMPTTLEIRGLCRRLKARKGLNLVVVDYLQLMGGTENVRGKSREQEIATITRALKLLAQELKVPVLLLSQLNRECEKRSNKRPVMSDLRDSGAIEQDADVVLFLYRDEVYNKCSDRMGMAELEIAKQRNGAVGDVALAWQASYTRFYDLEHDHGAKW